MISLVFHSLMLAANIAIATLILFGNVPGTHTSTSNSFIMGIGFAFQLMNARGYLLAWKAEK